MVSNHLASGCPAGQVEPKDSWKHGDTELMDALTRETVPHLGEDKEGGEAVGSPGDGGPLLQQCARATSSRASVLEGAGRGDLEERMARSGGEGFCSQRKVSPRALFPTSLGSGVDIFSLTYGPLSLKNRWRS